MNSSATDRKRGPTPRPIAERLAAKLVADPVTGCLNFTGYKSGGYGRIGNGSQGRTVAAHRAAYELAKGSIPMGQVIDHLCRNPSCCNPDHLEAITFRANVQRGESGRYNASKTFCKWGHPLDEANTYLTRGGKRQCRACRTARRPKAGDAR